MATKDEILTASSGTQWVLDNHWWICKNDNGYSVVYECCDEECERNYYDTYDDLDSLLKDNPIFSNLSEYRLCKG